MIFPYNSLYAQAVAYTTYFELGAHVLSHSILSYFAQPQNKHLNRRKPENSSLLRLKNAKDIIINPEGTRMAKDGEKSHGLQTTDWKNTTLNFSRCASLDIAP